MISERQARGIAAVAALAGTPSSSPAREERTA